MMASRVTLLLLVSGLFAGMWSTDSPDGRTASERFTARKGGSHRVIPSSRGLRTPNEVQMSLRRAKSIRGPIVPLPRGIAVGNYLVVDQSGSTEVRTVTASEAFSSGRIEGHAAADHYSVRVGQSRWHFIRLDATAQSRLARLNGSGRPANLR